MGRMIRPSAQRGRLLWTAIAFGVALVAALVMVVADLADNAEVIATGLLASVFVAALWIGRTGGVTVAVVAAAVYAGLRVGDADDVGAAGVGVLVMARAMVFAAVGWFTPAVAPHLPGMATAVRPRHRASGAGMTGAPAGERLAPPSAASALAELGGSHGGDFGASPPTPADGYGAATEPATLDSWGTAASDTGSGAGGWDDAGSSGDDGAWDDEMDAPSPRWEEPLTPPAETWRDEPPLAQPAAFGDDPQQFEPVPWDHPTDPGVATGNGGHHGAGYDDAGHPGFDRDGFADRAGGVDNGAGGGGLPPMASPGPWGAPEPSPSGWDQRGDPRVPQVPVGWLDEIDEPPGDQSIPIGYTGELFLPPDLSMAGSPADVDHAGNGWTGPGDRQAPPSYPAMPTARVDGARTTSPPPQSPVPAAATSELVHVGAAGHTPTQDPETRLWNARFFRERLTAEVDATRRAQGTFSVVMVQLPDEPFRALPYRRQVALLRELGHQFVAAGVVDHLVHLPDGDRHWFAVILSDTDRVAAQEFETRLRTAIGGYLRHRGLQVPNIESAAMTSPDDDELMADVWSSLLGSSPSAGSFGH